MTVNEARELVRANRKQWRAALVEAPDTPLLDHPQASVILYEKAGAAYDQLRARKESLVGQGWRVEWGSLGKCIFVFSRGDERHVIGIDKPTRKRG